MIRIRNNWWIARLWQNSISCSYWHALVQPVIGVGGATILVFQTRICWVFFLIFLMQADSALSEFLQEIKNSPDDEAFVGKSSEDSEQVQVDTERSYHHHVVAILEELHAEAAGYVSYLREHLPKHVVLH